MPPPPPRCWIAAPVRIDDVAAWKALWDAFKTLTFDEQELQHLLGLLTAILAIGDVRFESLTVNHIGASSIQKGTSLALLERWLGVHETLIEAALTSRSTITRGETIVQAVDSATATSIRDAFAKGLCVWRAQMMLMLRARLHAALRRPLCWCCSSIAPQHYAKCCPSSWL